MIFIDDVDETFSGLLTRSAHRPARTEGSVVAKNVSQPWRWRRLAGRTTEPAADDGMTTVEYAVGTVVAAAFAAVLYKIVTGDSIVAGLTSLVNSALSGP